MKGIGNFVVRIPEKYSDTMTTESGLELYIDRRFSVKEAANTIVEVVETPFKYSGDIKTGSLLFIDATVLMQQDYAIGGEQENINLLDKKEGLYKVIPSLVILYQVDKDSEWTAFEEFFLAEKIKIEKEKIESKLIILIEETKTSFEKNKYKVFISNKTLKEGGVDTGDIIFCRKYGGVDVRFNNKEYVWLRSKDAIAKEIVCDN